MKALIGYTGFVGSNIERQMKFDEKYNSKNIEGIKGKKFNFLVCAGVRAEKYLANIFPEKDKESIEHLIEVLDTLTVKKFVLISTIDVYNEPNRVDENTSIYENALLPYGRNRRLFEKWVLDRFDDASIIRLPALFGKGLKKNFIYDCMTKIPTMIMADKFGDLLEQMDGDSLKKYYSEDQNGNYEINKNLEPHEKNNIITILEALNFTSLNFTDSRNEYPFYCLDNIGKHIMSAIEHNIKIINLAVEPVSAREVAKFCFNIDFVNINKDREPIKYDIKTNYDKLFNGENGYIYNKDEVLKQIKTFVFKEL